MTEKTKEALKNFAGVSTYSSGHDLDWERFYQFVAEAYREGDINIGWDDLNQELKEIKKGKEAMDEKMVQKLLDKYKECIDIINIYETGSRLK